MFLRLLISGFLFSGSVVISGQGWNGYNIYGRYAIHVPDTSSQSAEALATYIMGRYETPKIQLHAIYSWITANIRYNDDSSYYFNRVADYNTKIAATLRRRKGVCENYADLLADLASKIGLTTQVIYGYPVGTGAERRNTGHAWCAINLNEEWWLFDPTWDATHQDGFQYYMISPSIFIQTHIPFDPLWQLLDKPVNFRNTTTKNKTVFHYKDSIKAYLQMDSIQQYLAIERRMRDAGATSELFKLWQRYNRMNIAILAGERDMELYNDAVDKLNLATGIFNSFVEYRNNGFIPQKPDEMIRTMLEPVGELIAEANKKLDEIGLLIENFQYNTEGIRKQLHSLGKHSEEQKAFLKKYLAATPGERPQLFYR